jgi:hypothetical protein
MLFNIALQRKAARRDFAGLKHVLGHGYALGLAGTPMASQAAEMLERVAVCATTHETQRIKMFSAGRRN